MTTSTDSGLTRGPLSTLTNSQVYFFQFFNLLEENDLPKVNWNSYQKALFYPAVLAPVVYAFQRAYTRPSSHYIRKLGLAFAIFGGFQLGARSDRRDYNIFLMDNYHHFSPEFKLALSTGDARYLGQESEE